MEQKVDLVVLGGGGAGVYAATRAAKLGAIVILVESRRIGGVCLNWGWSCNENTHLNSGVI